MPFYPSSLPAEDTTYQDQIPIFQAGIMLIELQTEGLYLAVQRIALPPNPLFILSHIVQIIAHFASLKDATGNDLLSVCTYDSRGIGGSTTPQKLRHYSTKLMAQDALGLLDHLQWKKVHVIGLSLGGTTLALYRFEEDFYCNVLDTYIKVIHCSDVMPHRSFPRVASCWYSELRPDFALQALTIFQALQLAPACCLDVCEAAMLERGLQAASGIQ